MHAAWKLVLRHNIFKLSESLTSETTKNFATLQLFDHSKNISQPKQVGKKQEAMGGSFISVILDSG
jgi:hypothetical protein